MPKVGLFNKEGQQVGDIQLNEQVFGVEVNKYALHQVVVAQLANKRQGTQSAKTRSEVRGGALIEPCLALPVPFCLQGLIPPPLTSALVLAD